MATVECQLAMCISRLVEFELLLEFKIEQKRVLHWIPRVVGCVKPAVRSSRPSYIGRILRQIYSELANYVSIHSSIWIIQIMLQN
jgi:hypothetical protein